jgi:hypothetical protein
MTRSAPDGELEALYDRLDRESTPSAALLARTASQLRSAGVLRRRPGAIRHWMVAAAAMLAGVLIGRWSLALTPESPAPRGNRSAEATDLPALAVLQHHGTVYAEELDRVATGDAGTTLADLERAQEAALAIGRAIRVAESRLGLDRRPGTTMAPVSTAQPQVWF